MSALLDIHWSYALKAKVRERMDFYQLSPRQRDICWGLFHGCSNSEIAESLGVEYATVKNHIYATSKKINQGDTGLTRTEIVLHLIGWIS